jgi:hypothetical protein
MKDLRSDGDCVAELAAGDLTAPVPTCPGWTLGDLVRHVGDVHRWQTAAVRDDPDGFPAADSWQVAPKQGQSLAAWFEVGLDEAIAVMSAADPALDAQGAPADQGDRPGPGVRASWRPTVAGAHFPLAKVKRRARSEV